MELSASESAREALHDLINDDNIPKNTTLAGLSNLTQSDLSLFKNAWDNIDDERRLQIVNRLVEMTEESIEFDFDAIFKYCLKDTVEDIRCLSIEGLWENEETALVDSLIELLEQDDSGKVQATAASALGKFSILAEFGKLRPEITDKIREALLAAVDDRDKSIEVTRRVLEAVAPISLPDVKEAITNAYNSIDLDLKISALFAMGKSCDPEWLSVLISELENDEPEIRYEAAVALGELEDEESVPYLIRLIEDEDMEVKLAVIQSLGKIGTSSSTECLLLCLESADEAIREAAQEALQETSASDDPLSFRT